MGRPGKLDPEAVSALRREGMTLVQIAERFGVSHSAVSQLCKKVGVKAGTPSTLPSSLEELTGEADVVKPQYEREAEWLTNQTLDLLKCSRIYMAFPPPKDRSEAMEHERLMQAHLERGKKTLGLSEGGDGKGAGVNINILKNLSPEMLQVIEVRDAEG